jgi:hypothetical protein
MSAGAVSDQSFRPVVPGVSSPRKAGVIPKPRSLNGRVTGGAEIRMRDRGRQVCCVRPGQWR